MTDPQKPKRRRSQMWSEDAYMFAADRIGLLIAIRHLAKELADEPRGRAGIEARAAKSILTKVEGAIERQERMQERFA
jgi:hypothetical protein